MGSIAICIPCRMPASTNGTKIFCIYCGFAKDTYTPPQTPVVHVDDSWKKKLQWKQIEQPGGFYQYYLEGNGKVVDNTIQVYRNGLLMSSTRDYRETNNSVTFNSCTSNGDTITIQYVKEGY